MLSFTKPLSRGVAAARGLLAAVLGGVFLVWPSITIGTVVVLFAIYALADAVASGARAFASGARAGDRILNGLRAVVEIGAAVFAIVHTAPTAAVMTVVIGLYLIALGVIQLAASSQLSKLGAGGTGRRVVGGSLSIVAGALLVASPGIGAVTLAVLFGAYLFVHGVTLLLVAAATDTGKAVVDPLVRA